MTKYLPQHKVAYDTEGNVCHVKRAVDIPVHDMMYLYQDLKATKDKPMDPKHFNRRRDLWGRA